MEGVEKGLPDRACNESLALLAPLNNIAVFALFVWPGDGAFELRFADRWPRMAESLT